MSPSHRTALACAAAVILLVPGMAAAQTCLISGPSNFCGASTQLCGPVGAAEYQWTGPGIVGATDGQCVTVSAPGTYSLRLFDADNGLWSAPCTRTLSQTGGPLASIDGPGSVCGSQTITLCGPSGSFSYAWSGPGGFQSSASCVQIGTPGTFTLVVTDPSSGCVSAPASHEVAIGSCGGSSAINCPRPAWWWGRGCMDSESHGSVPAATMATVAACVDAHSERFDWSNEVAGFCSTVRRHPLDLRARAHRQFAAVLANMCAGEQHLTDREGRPVTLDPGTTLTMPGVSGTLADWLAATDASLARLSHRRAKELAVKNEYCAIIRAGWNINHGIGIGATCFDGSTTIAGTASVSGLDLAEDETLDAEMADDASVALSLESAGPNPFRDATVVAFTLAEASDQDVSVGVYDLTGRLVRELTRGPRTAGRFEVRWDGRDASGHGVPNGMYFVQARIGGDRMQTRLTLMR